jgi:hypothetical protein
VNNRGGPRKGAGRPKGTGIKRGALTMRPAAWCSDYIKLECKRLGISQSQWLMEAAMLWQKCNADQAT